MSSEADEEGIDLFQEPDGFYEPEKEATFASYQLLSGEEITVRLVGHNPLWGHHLWNAGLTTAQFFDSSPAGTLTGKTVLELGAGAGLPSLICALHGAAKVVVTDYPDPPLIDNLRWNMAHCCQDLRARGNMVAEGYVWGADVGVLLGHLPQPCDASEEPVGFDVLILADVLFNHSEHGKLVRTVSETLKKSGGARAYVFFTPYRPWLLERDVAFFEGARGAGLVVEKTFEKVLEKVMFEEDPGDELLRRTVYGYELSWKE